MSATLLRRLLNELLHSPVKPELLALFISRWLLYWIFHRRRGWPLGFWFPALIRRTALILWLALNYRDWFKQKRFLHAGAKRITQKEGNDYCKNTGYESAKKIKQSTKSPRGKDYNKQVTKENYGCYWWRTIMRHFYIKKHLALLKSEGKKKKNIQQHLWVINLV